MQPAALRLTLKDFPYAMAQTTQETAQRSLACQQTFPNGLFLVKEVKDKICEGFCCFFFLLKHFFVAILSTLVNVTLNMWHKEKQVSRLKHGDLCHVLLQKPCQEHLERTVNGAQHQSRFVTLPWEMDTHLSAEYSSYHMLHLSAFQLKPPLKTSPEQLLFHKAAHHWFTSAPSPRSPHTVQERLPPTLTSLFNINEQFMEHKPISLQPKGPKLWSLYSSYRLLEVVKVNSILYWRDVELAK